MEYILFMIMRQKTRFKNFRNIGYWYQLLVHEWAIYRYQP